MLRKAKTKPPTVGGAKNDDGGRSTAAAAASVVGIVAASARTRRRADDGSELLSNLTPGRSDTTCRLHRAGPALAHRHPRVEKMKKVRDNRDKTKKLNPVAMWNGVMDLVPRNVHPDYRDRTI
jgi:hypothetical protein